MTQFDMYSLDLNATPEAIGLLKMDYLGLRTLTVLHESINLVEKYHGKKIDPYKIPLDEEGVFKMLGEGDTTGVFQMESSGMRQVARELRPNRVEDIMVLVALYRPGPMEMIPKYIEGKNDPSKVEYPHPAIKEILEDTYGVLVYQEQCMEIAHKMAGFSLGRGDILRRAIGKKKRKLMAKEKVAFVKGAVEQGYDENAAEKVFGFIEKFAAYGFNRSHSASYGMLAYQTAYMKAVYPMEFFAALLTTERGNTDKLAKIVKECQEKQIPILKPDINHSEKGFLIEEQQKKDRRAIRYSLSAIKNVGDAVVEEIVKERQRNGRYEDFLDFCKRVDTNQLNSRTVESLIHAGALDSFGQRSALLEAASEYMEMGKKHQKMQAVGQESLFGLDDTVDIGAIKRLPNPEGQSINEQRMLRKEKEVFGFYFTKHP